MVAKLVISAVCGASHHLAADDVNNARWPHLQLWCFGFICDQERKAID